MTLSSTQSNPLWYQLAELYLDSPVDYSGLAVKLKASQVPVNEIERILFQEVHPVLYANLLTPAGQWGAWEKNWLKNQINDQLEKCNKKGILGFLNRTYRIFILLYSKHLISGDWKKVKALLVN